MMEDAIQNSCRQSGVIVEDRRPLFKSFIRCKDDGSVFVAFADDLEKQVGAGLVDGHIAELVNGKDIWLGEGFNFLAETMVLLGR